MYRSPYLVPFNRCLDNFHPFLRRVVGRHGSLVSTIGYIIIVGRPFGNEHYPLCDEVMLSLLQVSDCDPFK